jgi:Zn-dependent peptidase ImmA (M78 family)
MNTVKIGDSFEKKSYEVISKAVENGELGISESASRVFQKKGYYSRDREKDIIFDLSIEVWPTNAERYTLLYLIECKSSNSKKVPVDDIEEFYSKIIQVSGANVKGVLITDNSFQEGVVTFAKNRGIMLIEVSKTGDYKIILHRTNRGTNDIKEEDIDLIFEKFIKKALGPPKIEGLQKLSSDQIEVIANAIHEEYSRSRKPIVINAFLEFVSKKYKLTIDTKCDLETINGKKILGYYSVKENKIFMDQSLILTNQTAFVLGHELGHFFLHKELTVNQVIYNDFEDSEYNFYADKHLLKNDKNWIEWQANRFAISLFLPSDVFLSYLYEYRKSIGISRYNYIYLDNQRINQEDYRKTVDYLAYLFGISKTVVRYRIDELKIITHAESNNDIGSHIRRYLLE